MSMVMLKLMGAVNWAWRHNFFAQYVHRLYSTHLHQTLDTPLYLLSAATCICFAGSWHGHWWTTTILYGTGSPHLRAWGRRSWLWTDRSCAAFSKEGSTYQGKESRPQVGAESWLLWYSALCICKLYYLSFHWPSRCLWSVQIPNPLFDLAGITCGHFLIPFWTFFGATLIGKAIIKMHIQVSWVLVAECLELAATTVLCLCFHA